MTTTEQQLLNIGLTKDASGNIRVPDEEHFERIFRLWKMDIPGTDNEFVAYDGNERVSNDFYHENRFDAAFPPHFDCNTQEWKNTRLTAHICHGTISNEVILDAILNAMTARAKELEAADNEIFTSDQKNMVYIDILEHHIPNELLQESVKKTDIAEIDSWENLVPIFEYCGYSKLISHYDAIVDKYSR